MGFKVGDRVRVTESKVAGATALRGDEGCVTAVPHTRGVRVLLDNPRGLTRRHEHGSYVWYFANAVLELVEDLKPEVGARVVIGDGVDEWTIVYAPLSGIIHARRGTTAVDVRKGQYRVVKPKPEPPKPDYYVNAPGIQEPQDGDVVLGVAALKLAVYRCGYFHWLHESGTTTRSERLHLAGSTRRLLVRGHEPYTG